MTARVNPAHLLAPEIIVLAGAVRRCYDGACLALEQLKNVKRQA